MVSGFCGIGAGFASSLSTDFWDFVLFLLSPCLTIPKDVGLFFCLSAISLNYTISIDIIRRLPEANVDCARMASA